MNSTYDCLYIAMALSTALWGSGTVQLYFYYDKYRKSDKLWMVILLLSTYVLDTTHQALILKSLYIYLVENLANGVYLGHMDRSLIDSAILADIVGACVQSIFIRRIWILSGNNIRLTGFLFCLVMAQLTVTLVYFGMIYNFTEIGQLSFTRKAEHAMNIITAVVDTTIATTMVFLLRSKRTGFKGTDTIVDRLILYSIGTGFLTGLLCLVAVVTSLAFPKTFIWILVMIILPKLYFNSMLASLNCRQGLREDLADISNREPTLPFHSRTLSLRNATGNNGFLGSLNFSPTTPVSFVSEPETAYIGHGNQKQGRTPSIQLYQHDSMEDLDLKCQGTEVAIANVNVLNGLPQVHAKT